MPWFDTTDDLVCMAFYNARGALDACMEIAPPRITWLGDPDEAIGALAVGMLRSGAMIRWDRNAWGQDGRAWTHDLAHYGDAALAIHLGAPVPNAAEWRLVDGEVVAPDGQRWATQAFCGGPGLGVVPINRHKVDDLLAPPPSESSVGPIVRGALLALEDRCPQTNVPALCRFLVACAPMVDGGVYSQTILNMRRNHCKELVSTAFAHRIVHGDRAYAPTRLRVEDGRFPRETPEAQMWRALGQEGARIALDSGVSARVLDSKVESTLFPNAGLSAHTVLLAEHTIQRVHDLFHTAVRPM